MIAFTLRRLLQAVPLALLTASLVFALIHLVPGDPTEVMLGEGARPADIEALRHRLGLDQPLWVQYRAFLLGVLKADLGASLGSGEAVTRLLARHYPATLQLALAAMAVALALSFPLGVLAALHRGGSVDLLSRFLSLLGVSLPNFWLGPMLILLFAIHWDLFPVSGRAGPASLVLPALTLGASLSGLLTRMIRTSLLAEIGKPYLTTARAKGLNRPRAVAQHALKNALIPVVTVLGLQFGALLTGAVITESIFSWPGVGRLLIQSVQRRDYPVVQGGVLLFALTYILVNLATDLLYAYLDPRLRDR